MRQGAALAGKASHGGVRLAPVTKAPRSEAGTALEGEATLTGIGNAPSSHAIPPGSGYCLKIQDALWHLRTALVGKVVHGGIIITLANKNPHGGVSNFRDRHFPTVGG